jgi:DNA-binding XRE family transcriptional regulator
MTEPKITLKAARVNAELTLDDVAEIMGKSKQTIEKHRKRTSEQIRCHFCYSHAIIFP